MSPPHRRASLLYQDLDNCIKKKIVNSRRKTKKAKQVMMNYLLQFQWIKRRSRTKAKADTQSTRIS